MALAGIEEALDVAYTDPLGARSAAVDADIITVLLLYLAQLWCRQLCTFGAVGEWVVTFARVSGSTSHSLDIMVSDVQEGRRRMSSRNHN